MDDPRSRLTLLMVGSGVVYAVSACVAYYTQGWTLHDLGIAMFSATNLCHLCRKKISLLYNWLLFPAIGGMGWSLIYGHAHAVIGFTTLGVGMALLGAIVYATGFDFRRLTGIASAALIALIVIVLSSRFVDIMHPPTYALEIMAIGCTFGLIYYGILSWDDRAW